MGEGKKRVKEAYAAIFAGDFERAIAAFHKAIELEPDNASYYYKLSITCRRSNRLPEAIKAAEQACQLAPYSHTYRYHYDVLRSLQTTRQALKDLEKNEDNAKIEGELDRAIDWDPLNEKAQILMGLLLMRQSRFLEAGRMFQEVIKLQPDNSEAKKYLQVCLQEIENRGYSTKH